MSVTAIMPTMNKHLSDKTSRPDYSQLYRKEQSTTRATNTLQSESRSAAPTGPTALPSRRDSLNMKNTGERDSSTQPQSESRYTGSSFPCSTARKCTTCYLKLKGSSGATEDSDTSARGSAPHQLSARPQDTRAPPVHHSENEQQNRSHYLNRTRTSESQGSDYTGYTQWTSNYILPGGPKDAYTGSSFPCSTARKCTTCYIKFKGSSGATEDTSARGSAPHQLSARLQDTRAPPVHYSENEQQNRSHHLNRTRTSESQGSGYTGYTQWTSNYILPGGPKDAYQDQYYRTRDELKQTRAMLGNNDRELEPRRRDGELRQASHWQIIDNLRHDNQRSTDTISSLQNELINIYRQLKDAEKLSEVREKDLFLANADTLTISESEFEVGEKVTALNVEIFRAAATLGEALVHKRREVSQTDRRDLDAAAAVSQEMIGEKLTKLLIAQSQKPGPEVNALLVQIVLQIFMVKFCVLQSWYPGDCAVGKILSAIYSQIRSTEEQAVSGLWRALTRAHTIRPSTDTWIKELYQKLESIFEIASWAPRSPENIKSYGNRLPSIFKAINELRLAMGKKFTSTDLDIFVFECDHIYDPAVMEDAYGDESSGKRAPEAIVGTTGIGLAKLIATERTSTKDVPQFQTLIAAKIVLTSTVNEALESTTIKENKPVENMDGANQDGRD